VILTVQTVHPMFRYKVEEFMQTKLDKYHVY